MLSQCTWHKGAGNRLDTRHYCTLWWWWYCQGSRGPNGSRHITLTNNSPVRKARPRLVIVSLQVCNAWFHFSVDTELQNILECCYYSLPVKCIANVVLGVGPFQGLAETILSSSTSTNTTLHSATAKWKWRHPRSDQSEFRHFWLAPILTSMVVVHCQLLKNSALVQVSRHEAH